MPIIDVRVVPVGTDHTSISSYITASAAVLLDRGIEHQITATGTVLETDDLDAALDAAKAMHRAVFEKGADRVVTQVTIDERRDKELSMREMVAAVRPEEAYAGVGETFA